MAEEEARRHAREVVGRVQVGTAIRRGARGSDLAVKGPHHEPEIRPLAERGPRGEGARGLLEGAVGLLVVGVEVLEAEVPVEHAGAPGRAPRVALPGEAPRLGLGAEARHLAEGGAARGHVDHSREGVGAVEAARRALHDLDALELEGQLGPGVPGPAGLVDRHPVHEHPREVRRAAAQEHRALGPDAARAGDADPGHVLHEVQERRRLSLGDTGGVENRDHHAQGRGQRLGPRGRHHDVLAHGGGREHEVEGGVRARLDPHLRPRARGRSRARRGGRRSRPARARSSRKRPSGPVTRARLAPGPSTWSRTCGTGDPSRVRTAPVRTPCPSARARGAEDEQGGEGRERTRGTTNGTWRVSSSEALRGEEPKAPSREGPQQRFASGQVSWLPGRRLASNLPRHRAEWQLLFGA